MTAWPTSLACACVLAVGLTALWHGTDGGSAWTAERARRLAVMRDPPRLPPRALRDAGDRSLSLAGFERRVLLVDFIYTRCPTVCLDMGATFRRLQSELSALGLHREVQLLSLTFDQVNDGPEQLADYLTRFSAQSDQWVAARFENESDLKQLLKQLGVVVIPEPRVGFIHNAAIYLVYDGRVVGIYDIDDRAELLRAVQWQLHQT